MAETKAKAAKKKAKTAQSKKKTGGAVKKVVEQRKKRKTGRKVNLLKLCTEMNKMSHDAVDREIIKRFRTIIDTGEEDISKVRLTSVLNDPKNVQLSDFHESHQPYIKHYLFMLKRDKNRK